MDNTARANQNRTKSTHLPLITTNNNTISSTSTYNNGISYSQRYEHMTKIANYNEMAEGQIWKEYEKLRLCLKELNEEVLYHMEKKAHLNLYAKDTPLPPTTEATLLLLDEERKTNESRLQIFLNEGTILEQRVSHLSNKSEYLQDINNEIELAEAKIKEIHLENKELKRKQKMVSKDLLAGPSFLEKLVIEEECLHYAKKKYEKYDQIYKESTSKIKEYTEKTEEFQSVLENRLHHYKQQEGYISEEMNLEKFEELQAQKTNLQKYENVYKRNYLMKLKELENLVNSINKHDQIIEETEGNIKVMRGEIDQISAMVVMNNNNRRRGSVSVMQNGGNKTGRSSVVLDNSTITNNQNNSGGKDHEKNINSANDKNRPNPMRF